MSTTTINPNSSMGPAATPRVTARHPSGRTWKRHIRLEKIARLSKDGMLSNAQICAHLGITIQMLMSIKSTKEYQAKMIELTTGVISEYDKEVREVVANAQEELASMVPMALLKLRDAILSPNPSISLKASLEVLDREGTNAKVSKVTVHHEEKPDLAGVNAKAFDIMALLGRPVGEEVRVEMSGGFTVSASEHRTQTAKMTETIDEKALEALDLSNQPKQ